MENYDFKGGLKDLSLVPVARKVQYLFHVCEVACMSAE